jgi:hypothetical protein
MLSFAILVVYIQYFVQSYMFFLEQPNNYVTFLFTEIVSVNFVLFNMIKFGGIKNYSYLCGENKIK